MLSKKILQEMKDSVGTKEPVVFFDKLVDLFELLFSELNSIKTSLHQVKVQSALAIQWEPKVASELLAKQIEILRSDSNTYFTEISSLKKAYAENKVTQDYNQFVNFWVDTLGWHPFLEYDK